MKYIGRTKIRIVATVTLLGLLIVGLTGPAQAAEFVGGDRVVIEASEVIDDDLFVSGNRVEVNGTIQGDLFAAGSEVVVNGTVEGSLFIAGQLLTVNGQVDGSLYGGGYALSVGPETSIGRNLFFGGFSLTTGPGSTVGRDLYAGNYQSELNGDIGRDLSVGGGALELNGAVGGDVNAEVSSSDEAVPPTMPGIPGSVPSLPPGFRMGEQAQVGGELNITETTPNRSREERGAFGLSQEASSRVGEFIALLIIGGIILYLASDVVQQTGANIQQRPLPSLGWGLLLFALFIIGVPIIAVMVILLAFLLGLLTLGNLLGITMTLGIAALALLATAFIFALSLLTKIVVAYLIGRFLLDRFAPQMAAGFGKNFLALVIGALIYEIVRAIPFGVGWLVGVIATLLGLGAIYFFIQEQRKKPATGDPAPAEATTTA